MKGKPYMFVGVVVAIAVALWLIFFTHKQDTSVVIVILEAHAGDAERALPEFIKEAQYPVVVKTFFTENISTEAPGTSTDPELLQDTTKDIQGILASYSDKKIEVYAPAIYTEKIGTKDQALLHQAFVDAVRNYPKEAAESTFYFYEDPEYVAEFDRNSASSLLRTIEDTTQFVVERIKLEPAGEIVYKIIRI